MPQKNDKKQNKIAFEMVIKNNSPIVISDSFYNYCIF